MSEKKKLHSYNKIKAKANSKSINNSGIHSSSSGLLNSAPPSAAHTAFLINLDRLQCTAAAVLGAHAAVLVSPKCWIFLLKLSCTFASRLSCIRRRTPHHWNTSGTLLLSADAKKTFPKRFHLNNSGIFWIRYLLMS